MGRMGKQGRPMVGGRDYSLPAERCAILHRDEERELAIRWRDHRDVDARNRLVEANVRLVIAAAGEYVSGSGFEDVVHEGVIGLMYGIDRYDPDRGFKLASYAIWWVRARILSYLLRNRCLVTFGTTAAQRRAFLSFGRACMAADAATDPAERTSIMARTMGIRVDQVDEVVGRLGRADVPLDVPRGPAGEGRSIAEDLADDQPSPEDLAEAREWKESRRESLNAALAELPERERKIVRARFLADEPASLKKIGKALGISRERVRQLQVRALARVRAALALEEAARAAWAPYPLSLQPPGCPGAAWVVLVSVQGGDVPYPGRTRAQALQAAIDAGETPATEVA